MFWKVSNDLFYEQKTVDEGTALIPLINQPIKKRIKWFSCAMANDKDADKRLLEFGLGSVTWWGYSSSCDLSSFVEKPGGMYPNVRDNNYHYVFKLFIWFICVCMTSYFCS